MKHLFHYVCLALTLTMAACAASDSPADNLISARQAYADGSYDVARTICDSIAAPARIDRLSVDQMCNLSMIYIALSEKIPASEEEIVASAARCLGRAIDRNPDSVNIFIHSLPVEEQSLVVMLKSLCQSIDHPYRYSDYDDEAEMADSIAGPER